MKQLVTMAAALLLATSTLRAQDALRVGSVTVSRGTKATGLIHIPDGVDKGLDIPVSVVHGKEPGKVLALIAGTHGYEYTSILALQRLLPQLDPTRMKGSVILVHMANPETFFDVTELVTADDFGVPAYAAMFRAIVACDNAGKPFDQITVGDELSRAGWLTRVGGLEELERLVGDGVANAAAKVLVHEAESDAT